MHSPFEPLRGLQSAFLGDLNGLAERTPFERASVFRPPPRGTVEDRWHVYAEGYFARLLEVLEAEYPAVRFVLGAEAFGSLASRHLATFPPSTFDLAHAGRHLPAYIAADPLAEDLPFLPDLATLERAVSEAFVAADSEPVRLERVLALGARAAADVPVRLSPGTALVRSSWPTSEVWKARLGKPEDVDVELEARSEALLVHRPGERVLVTKLDEESARLVDAFKEGRSIAGALDDLVDPARPARAEIARLVAAFRRLVDLHVLTEASG
jgi:hypothetical protein